MRAAGLRCDASGRCCRFKEYGHTLYDLLGVYYDVMIPGALNDDPRWHGFDRLGSLLTLSPSHVDRYLRAAERYILRLGKELRDLQITRGGPIIMLQVENEAGTYGSVRDYSPAAQQQFEARAGSGARIEAGGTTALKGALITLN